MNFKAYKYELFLKLLNNECDEVKDRFETEHIDIDIQLNNFQWTPLQIAAYKGNMVLVEYFLNKGAKKDYRNSGGFTAHMLAERSGFLEISGFIQGFTNYELKAQKFIED